MDERQVELLKTGAACHLVRDYVHHFANPVRLRILCELTLGDRRVGDLVEAAGARQSTVSQQLNLLRLAGLVERTRDGSHRVYRLGDPLARETMEYLVSLAQKLVSRQELKNGPDDGECICG